MTVNAAFRKLSIHHYHPLIFLFGLSHGLSYAQELLRLDIGLEHKLPALFIFNTAIDVGHYVAAVILFFLANFFWKIPHWEKIVSYTTGVLSVALLLVLFQEHVMTGKTDVLSFKSSQIATQYTLPVSQKSQTGGQRPRGARRLTNPVMSYLSVEPYEVRQEILIQTRAAVQFLGVNDEGKGSIPVESLEPVKKGILDTVQKANPILIDG